MYKNQLGYNEHNQCLCTDSNFIINILCHRFGSENLYNDKEVKNST